MGNGETKITYETVDKTNPQAREQGRQQALQENQRKLQELTAKLQQDRQNALEEAERLARLENDQNTEKLEEDMQQQRQRLAQLKAAKEKAEKEAQEEKAFLEMKESLLEYEFGSRIGQATFQELNTSDVDKVRIVLIGPTGSGKTSFIGTLERTLLGKDKQTAFEQGAGAEGTVNLEEYLSQLKFNLVDTRGFFDIDDQTFKECLNIMEGRIIVSETINRQHETEQETERPAAKFSDQAHAVVFVVKANDQRLRTGNYLERMKKIRDHFRYQGHSPVTVITCLDQLKTEKDMDEAFHEASAATGSPRDRTFFISNYTYENKDDSESTERRATDILDSVLYSAERYIKIQKLRLKHHGGAAGGSSAGGIETLEQMFSKMQIKYQWDETRVSRVVKACQEQEISTAAAFKECWEEIKDALGMSVGMKRLVSEELKRM